MVLDVCVGTLSAAIHKHGAGGWVGIRQCLVREGHQPCPPCARNSTAPPLIATLRSTMQWVSGGKGCLRFFSALFSLCWSRAVAPFGTGPTAFKAVVWDQAESDSFPQASRIDRGYNCRIMPWFLPLSLQTPLGYYGCATVAQVGPA